MKSSRYTDRDADRDSERTDEREKLIGLGKQSISKSYYPELKSRLDELEQFRALLDRVNDAIFVVDADTGTVVDTSGATDSMLNCAKGEIRGTPFKDLLPEHIRRYADNLFNNETKTIRLETEFGCSGLGEADGVPVEMTVRLVTLNDQRRAIIVARDISERKRSELALKQSHDMLEIRVQERTRELDQANKAKSHFLSMVSHELRTPLTSVLGFAKIIRKKMFDTILPALAGLGDERVDREAELIMKNIDIINTEGERLTLLINDVLDLAKMEANRVEYILAPLEPVDFIQRSVDATASLFDNTDVVLLVEIDRGLPVILGDRDRLIQVMVNLLSNAVKFTEKGTITCSARLVGDKVRIGVRDTGIGIPEDRLEDVFEQFTQVPGGASEKPGGTGLGLPICRHIVREHGGDIWAESVPGHGSEIIFTLPVLTDDQ